MITSVKQFLKESNTPIATPVKINEENGTGEAYHSAMSIFYLFDDITTLMDDGILDSNLVIDSIYTFEDINSHLSDEGKTAFATEADLLSAIDNARKIIEFAKSAGINEGLLSAISNLVNNDKKMGEVLVAEFNKLVNFYIKSKPVNIEGLDGKVVASSDLTADDFKQALELAKDAKFYDKDIKFENDQQKLAWSYLKGRATKIMGQRAGNPIGPHS